MKHAVVTIKIPLAEDELERGPQYAAVKAIKEEAAKHLIDGKGEITHAIAGPEPEKAPRKARKALGAGLAAVESPAPDAPDPQPETVPEAETPAPRGRHRAAA